MSSCCGGCNRLRFIHLQPRSLRQQRASIRLLPAAPQPRWQKCLARINRSTVLRTSKSQHLWGSGYVVLLLLTGLPPFIIADALVLLLGVTPAFGTVSPTSCKDGSRYMATRQEAGHEERRKRKHYLVRLKNQYRHRPQQFAQSYFPWSKAIRLRGSPVLKQ